MNDIQRLVNELPEQYQSIYGYPQFDDASSRMCIDRCQLIINVINKVTDKVKRPLRVLDLGCAQGYFCFKLAELGCKVVGVDYLENNINLCKAIAKEHQNLDVSFEVGDITTRFDEIREHEYDIILGLSLLHHICYSHGYSFVKQKLDELANKCKVFIYEAALFEEPLYWAKSLPEEPEELIKNFKFYLQLDNFKTHLSIHKRPLFYCSNEFWYINGEVEKIVDAKFTAHGYHVESLQDTRRYYCSENKFLKLYYFRGKYKFDQEEQITNEINFYKDQNNSALFSLPKYYCSQSTEYCAAVVMERIDGELLSDLIQEGKKINCDSVVAQILDYLSELENNKFYYNDLRCWNIMLEKDGRVRLIDAAAITKSAKDVTYPYNIYLSFVIFIYELYHKLFLREDMIRQLRFSPVWFNQQVGDWMAHLWAIPYSEWTFSLIRELFAGVVPKSDDNKQIHSFNIYLWMGVIEDFVYRVTGFDTIDDFVKNQRKEIMILQQEGINKNNEIARLRQEAVKRDQEDIRKEFVLVKESTNLRQEIARLQQEVAGLQQEVINRDIAVASLHQHINVMGNTFSWKITRPLRFRPKKAKEAAKKMLAKVRLYVNKKPKVKKLLLRILSHFPMLKARVKAMNDDNKKFKVSSCNDSDRKLDCISDNVLKNYSFLKKQINNKN